MRQRLQLLQQMLASSPNDTFTLFAIAKEYEGMGELEQALAHYLQLRATDPDYVGLYYHLGKLYEKTEQFEVALQTYRAGMDIAKKLGDSHSLSELNGARMELDDSDEDFYD
jgi:tetratricopeptide (TPR) repeat protein